MTVEPTLDDAHRLLREGRVDRAIDAYTALLKNRPDDWTTANRLGDLYVQTGQLDAAVEQFSHVAQCLVERNLLPKAAALYKKVLKVAPGDESTRSQLVDLALRQGFLVEALGHLTAMAEQRRATGDHAGALEVQHRIDSLRRPALAATEAAPAERVDPDDTQVAMAPLPTGPDAREEATAVRKATGPGPTATVTLSEGRVERTAQDPQRQLKLQLIEDEVRAGRLKRTRQLVLVVLSEASDATEHILDLAKRLTAEAGDATVMCADALLDSARRGQAPPDEHRSGAVAGGVGTGPARRRPVASRAPGSARANRRGRGLGTGTRETTFPGRDRTRSDHRRGGDHEPRSVARTSIHVRCGGGRVSGGSSVAVAIGDPGFPNPGHHDGGKTAASLAHTG